MRAGLALNESDLHPKVWPWCRALGTSARWLFAVLVVLAIVGAGASAFAAACDDADGDGYQKAGTPSGCTLGTLADCDDTDSLTYPGAPELCDNADNDCDGSVDEGPTGGDLGCLEGAGPGCPSPLPASPDPDPTVGVPFIADCCMLKGICRAGGTCDLDPQGQGGGTLPTYVPEGPQPFAKDQPSVCYDGIDNDCDGLTDSADNAPTPGGGPGDMCRLASDLFCNHFDDDFDGLIDEDFPNLGQPCTAGFGGCQKVGVYVCNAAGNGTECSATPGTPKPERLDKPGSCNDLVDNDCDGLIDVLDPDCQQPESCDGLDNDGDGVVDNGFAGLGDPCTVGVGECTRTGTVVCGLDKQSTRCDVTPGIASPEGPSGATCSDGLDNDCDGFTDMADPNCGTAGLAVQCSLPLKAHQKNDCHAFYEIHFSVQGGGPGTTVTAELLALSREGEILGALPVADGDKALLYSNIEKSDVTKIRLHTSGKRHHVTAPLPVLRVHAEEGGISAEAYCSPIPFVKAFEQGCCGTAGAAAEPGCCGSTSRSAGDTTPITVAIPGMDPGSLTLSIDGVDIFGALGLTPSTDFPGGPYGGPVTINGANVEISDLFVRTTSNTLTLNVAGLPCGGHLIVVNGSPLATAVPDGSKRCYVDDYRDKCVASVLGVEITSPQDQETDLPSPTLVQGSVCSGRRISSLKLNGLDQPITSQSFVKGDGTTSADTYAFDFQTWLPGTDLRRAVRSGETPLGSLDRGSNRLVADVVDEFGNRAFDSVIFAVGPVAKPGIGPLLSQAQAAARGTLASIIALDSTQAEIQNAFVLGLTEQAIDAIIGAKCAEKGEDFLNDVRNAFLNPRCTPRADPILKGAPCGSTDGANRCANAGGVCSDLVCHAAGDPIDQQPCPDQDAQRACTGAGGVCARLCGPQPGSVLDNGPCGNFGEIQNCQNNGGSCPASIQTIETPWCTCDIPAVIRPTDVVQLDPNATVTCDATLLDGQVQFTMTVPDLRVSLGVHGSCDGFLCADASINYDGSIDLTGMSVVLNFPEERFEGNPVDPALCGNGAVDAGEFCDPTAGDGVTGCPGDFPGGAAHCTTSTGTACTEDGDCPGGERCRPDAECNETCVACTQPPISSAPNPPIDDSFVDLGCGCTLVTILTIGLVVVAFIFGGPILGFGAIGIAALIFALSFQFDIETIAPPTAVQPDPIGIAEPMVDETVEEFGVAMKAKVDQVEINPQGLTVSLTGIFSILDPDNEIPEVPGAALTLAPAPMPPLSNYGVTNAGNAYFVLSDDTFNQLFAALSAGPMFKTGFETNTRKLCSLSREGCSADSDCPTGQTCDEEPLTVLTFIPNLNDSDAPFAIKALKLYLAARGITGSTPLIVHGRPEMPAQLLINDDPKRCGVSDRRCDLDDDCKQCSTSHERCQADADCPSGETCALGAGDTCQVKPPTPGVESDLRLTDFFLELIADRNANGLDGAYGTATNCFLPVAQVGTTGDCTVMHVCLDVSFLTVMQVGTCIDQATGQEQPVIQTTVEAVQSGRTQAPRGEVCGQIATETQDSQVTQSGFDTQTVDVFQENAEENTPPLCVQGLNLAGLGTFQNPRLISIDVPGGDPQFEDYLGITGDVVPPTP
jgi:hypothetical protein